MRLNAGWLILLLGRLVTDVDKIDGLALDRAKLVSEFSAGILNEKALGGVLFELLPCNLPRLSLQLCIFFQCFQLPGEVCSVCQRSEPCSVDNPCWVAKAQASHAAWKNGVNPFGFVKIFDV